jgi:membrane protease YdiL (CAAX protease family)
LRYHLRDPVALLLMVLLPVVILPLMMAGFANFQERQKALLDATDLRVHVTPNLVSRFEGAEGLVLVNQGSFASGDLHLEASGSGPPEKFEVLLRYQGSSHSSLQALSRARRHLEQRHEKDLAREAHALGFTWGPGEALQVTWVDLATEEQRSGQLFGRLVPLVLVFLMVSGGLYTALDLFAGEKERGTLETLLTTRINRGAVLVAKSLTVLAFGLITGWLALGAMWATMRLGLLDVAIDGLHVSGGSVLLLALMLIPLGAELTSLLVVAAAWAPDVRTGQAMAIPLLLVTMVPASLSAIPGVSLSPLTALIPIGNLTLAARDLLAGQASWGPLLLVASATGLHAWLAGALAARLLGRESVILGTGSKARRAHERFGPEVLATGATVLLCVWFLGQAAASLGLVVGHLATQVFLLGVPGLALVWWLGQPLRRTLSLTRPSGWDLGLGIVAGVASPGLSLLLETLQAPLLPLPTELIEAAEQLGFLQDLPLPVLLVAFALVPALAEETLFRGAFLGLLRNSLKPMSRCILVGLAFGLVHLSIYRILPTGAFGILLCVAVLRSRSLWVAVVMHALHNGLLLTWAMHGTGTSEPSFLWLALASTVAIAAVAGQGRK